MGIQLFFVSRKTHCLNYRDVIVTAG